MERACIFSPNKLDWARQVKGTSVQVGDGPAAVTRDESDSGQRPPLGETGKASQVG